MNELAHWIIDVGTGVLLGIILLGVLHLLGMMLSALPDRVPVITPAWYRIRDGIEWAGRQIARPVIWLDRKISR